MALVGGAGPTPVGAQDPGPCSAAEDFQYVPGLGDSCWTGSAWKVRVGPGSYLFTHGPDLAPESAGAPEGNPQVQPSPPACAGNPAGDRHGRVIYSNPNDKPNRLFLIATQLRALIHEANGIIRADAAELGMFVDLVMRCSGGQVEIFSEPMPFPSSQGTFGNIVQALQARGHTMTNVKYWVWYDGSAADCPGCLGIGNFHVDDRLSSDNQALGGPDYGVAFGVLEEQNAAEVMLHENGHNLGAVQPSAPNSDGGAHCLQSRDVMCDAVPGNLCQDRPRWDCLHNDYFNPSPFVGGYLASHWNLGSTLNSFYRFAWKPPDAPTVSCSPNPVRVGESTLCSVVATNTDPGMVMAYTVDFGDATPVVRLPNSGWVLPNTVLWQSHAYAEGGTFTIRAQAADFRPAASAVTLYDVRVGCFLSRTGNVTAGGGGVFTSGSVFSQDHGVPSFCANHVYVLRGLPVGGAVMVDDFNVCWLATPTDVIRCDMDIGPTQVGVVPPGAAIARISLVAGANRPYALTTET